MPSGPFPNALKPTEPAALSHPLVGEPSDDFYDDVDSWLKPILHRVVEEERELSEDEAMALAHATPQDLKGLCRAASILRDRGKGRVVTFSPKVFIPLTGFAGTSAATAPSANLPLKLPRCT